MSLDLNDLLRDWPHEPGQLKVRKILGTDGKEKFQLSPDDVGDLQAEGIQYYHRYIALFQLQDYLGVIRDTQRNLEMFEFVDEHCSNEDLAWSVVQFTPYVRMMNTRAKASIAMEREEFAEAVKLIEKGIEKIRAFY